MITLIFSEAVMRWFSFSSCCSGGCFVRVRIAWWQIRLNFFVDTVRLNMIII